MANAGKIDFPDHMKNAHMEWLNSDDTVAIESSMVAAMNTALGGSPYLNMEAFDPVDELDAMDSAVSQYNLLVDDLDYQSDWEDAVDSSVTKADAAIFDNEYDTHFVTYYEAFRDSEEYEDFIRDLHDGYYDPEAIDAFFTDGYYSDQYDEDFYDDHVLNDDYIDADITAFGNNLDDQIEGIVLPRFQGGMRDVNAVMSSAFVIGESFIEAMRNRDVAKYGTDLRMRLNLQRGDFKGRQRMAFEEGVVKQLLRHLDAKIKQRLVYEDFINKQWIQKGEFVFKEKLLADDSISKQRIQHGDAVIKERLQRNDFILKGVEAMLRDMMTRVELEKSVAHYVIEANRMRILAEKEKKDTENSIAISDGRWDLETYQYGANLLAAIGGGTVTPSGNDSPSKTSSALAGALAGAAVGGSVAGGWGSLAGGIIGGLSGLL